MKLLWQLLLLELLSPVAVLQWWSLCHGWAVDRPVLTGELRVTGSHFFFASLSNGINGVMRWLNVTATDLIWSLTYTCGLFSHLWVGVQAYCCPYSLYALLCVWLCVLVYLMPGVKVWITWCPKRILCRQSGDNWVTHIVVLILQAHTNSYMSSTSPPLSLFYSLYGLI